MANAWLYICQMNHIHGQQPNSEQPLILRCFFKKNGTSAPAIDAAHMDGRLESCNVEVSTENKEVPDLQQTTQQQQTNADAGDARPRKFRRLDLTSMPAGEVIDLD